MMTNARTAILTIVSNNYLHFARTLMQSVARHHPEAHRYVAIVDADLAPAQALADEFTAIPLEQLPLPDGDAFLYRYNILELNTAVKPWALQHLLDQGYQHVLYIDPDIRLYQPLTHAIQSLEQGAHLVLTPHLLAPIADDLRPTELDIRRAGTYNLGFCALTDTANTRDILAWWQSKLRHHCIIAHDQGIFVDQSWMDLVPGLFPHICILRHPGYNVAYWNLAQRNVERDADGQYQVNGQPLAFFHYSGLNPQNPEPFSKHQNRYTLSTLPPAVRQLAHDYCQTVIGNGLPHYLTLPYSYGTYRDGTPITDEQRIQFRQHTPAQQLARAAANTPFCPPVPPQPVAAAAASPAEPIQPARPHADPEAQQLENLYRHYLGRRPDASGLQAYQPHIRRGARFRVALSLGLSAEARARPRWWLRLLTPPKPCQATAEPPVPAAPPAPPAPAVPPVAVPDTAPLLPPEQLAQQQPPGINLIGYLTAELGIGEAARSLARACMAAQVPYSAIDVGHQTSNRKTDTSILPHAVHQDFPVDLLYVNHDQTPVTAQWLQQQGRPRAPYRIAYWHWEQPQLPPAALPAFQQVDEIWVPSTFVHDAVAAVAPVPVFKIPHAIHCQPTPGSTRAQLGLPDDDRILVLVMYDFHSYQHRKNPQAAIEAFQRAAANRPGVQLVIKTINGNHYPEACEALRQSVSGTTNIQFIDAFYTRQQTWDLQSHCDILLSLHRAEGFGLALAEMMSLGKAVIGTGWSANMDFMTPSNSMPVHYQLQPLTQDIGVYRAGLPWAEADTQHAAQCLDTLIRQPELRQAIGRQAAQDIQRQLSPQAVGQQLRQRLASISYWHPGAR